MGFGGQSQPSNIPTEIAKFFKGESGKTFVIKGKPRCGKTTFCLQIATDMVEPTRVFYIGTRGSNEPIYAKYPWLKDHDEKAKQLSAMTPAPQGQAMPQQQQMAPMQPQMNQQPPSLDGQQPQTPRALLQSMLQDQSQQGQQQYQPPQQYVPQPGPGQQMQYGKFQINRMPLFYLANQSIPQELEIAFRGIEQVYPHQSMLVINRIDRLAAKYNIGMEALVNVLKRIVVVEANTNLVLVLNKIDTALDHLADGIVTLKEFGGGMVFIGQIEVNKLLGVEIKQAKYLYNLLDGKFKLLKGITHWG